MNNQQFKLLIFVLLKMTGAIVGVLNRNGKVCAECLDAIREAHEDLPNE